MFSLYQVPARNYCHFLIHNKEVMVSVQCAGKCTCYANVLRCDTGLDVESAGIILFHRSRLPLYLNYKLSIEPGRNRNNKSQ